MMVMISECRTGLWGVDCQYQCGWCINDGGCFRKNGTCYDRMCEEDFMGEKCLQSKLIIKHIISFFHAHNKHTDNRGKPRAHAHTHAMVGKIQI